MLADGYFQFLFGFNTLGNISPVLNRVSGFFGDELILGSYLARLLPLVIFSFFFLKIEKKKIFLNIFLSILLIFLSGERSAFMFSILFFIYLILQIKEFRGYGLISLFFLIILFISFYFFSPNIKNRINQTIVELGIFKIYKPKYLIEKNLDPQKNVYKSFPGYRIGDLDKKDQQKKIFNNFNFFSPVHENYLYTSLKIFKDSPFFGKGPNTYRIYCADKNFMLDLYSCSTHPHNIYAQLIAETGLFGFLFILLIFFYFMIISIKHFICICFNPDNNKNKLSNLKLCLIASFLIALWPFSPSGNFFNNWLSIINFFPVGFYLSLKYIKI